MEVQIATTTTTGGIRNDDDNAATTTAVLHATLWCPISDAFLWSTVPASTIWIQPEPQCPCAGLWLPIVRNGSARTQDDQDNKHSASCRPLQTKEGTADRIKSWQQTTRDNSEGSGKQKCQSLEEHWEKGYLKGSSCGKASRKAGREASRETSRKASRETNIKTSGEASWEAKLGADDQIHQGSPRLLIDSKGNQRLCLGY